MSDSSRLTLRISWTIAGLAFLVGLSNLLDAVFYRDWSPLVALSHPSIWSMGFYGIGFLLIRFLNQKFVQAVQVILIVALSGPMVMTNGLSFFGMWFFILANVLIYKYWFLSSGRKLGFFLAGVYFAPWLVVRTLQASGLEGSPFQAFNNLSFLFSCLFFLYFIFEEEVRGLLAANKQKDEEIAEKEAEIARLVPLSVLGERVAHVTHSFKNNLSQVGTALYYLEQGNDPEKAKQKIEQFAKAMNERIDNILMVSRAGADQAPEVFDGARVLAGLNQVYLTEPAFLQRAKIELQANEATPVVAVRWDFLLMAENILKNALEALTTKGGYGAIRITLKDRVLTIANDGGAMALCQDCRDDCLNCSRYGKPGRTSKAKGSGHGLAQVFGTCRKYGWTLKIRTHDDWTIFEIGLTKGA